jgi:uncharacterized protein
VVAVDTNILVFSEIVTSPWHSRARDVVRRLAEGHRPWAIPWPCLYELLRVVTHPRVYHPPMPMARALADVGSLLGSPSLRLLAETPSHVEVMASVLATSGVSGNLVHDAHIAALCLEHGVAELLTADRDFSRFADLRVRNPLTDDPGR